MQHHWRLSHETIPNGPNRGIPISVTARPLPVFSPVEDFITSLGRDLNLYIRGLFIRYANTKRVPYSDARVKNLEVFVFPVSRTVNGREMRRRSGATKVKDLNPELFEEVLDQVQSEEEGQVNDYDWVVIIGPNTVNEIFNGGRASTGPPAFLKKFCYESTWYSQIDANGNINCAAYAICIWLNSTSNERTFQIKDGKPSDKAKREARQLQTQFDFIDFVSIADLKKFTDIYKTKRILTLEFVKGVAGSHATCHKGEYFNEDDENTCRLILFEGHWALTNSFDSFLKQASKAADRWRYCEECVKVIKISGKNMSKKDYPCHAVFREKRIKVEKPPCIAPQCNGEIHEDKCPYQKCKNCQVFMGSNDHRCILLPKNFGQVDPHTLYWNEDKKTYNFQTEDDDGKTTAYFAYDLETMIVKKTINESNPMNLIKPDLDSNYNVDLELLKNPEYTSVYNSMVPNLVVCTNIYSSKLPSNENEPCFAPKMIRFEGKDCMKKFIDFATSFNKGNNVFVAHNGSGFDSKFVYAEALKQSLEMDHILRGSNFVSLVIGKNRGPKTRFIDSMLHLPGSLSGLAKGFFGKSLDKNLRESLTKGYFPHAFNTPENQDYVGPIPSLEYYTLDTSKIGSGASKYSSVIDIQEWHKKQKGEWNFRNELIKYCDIDVIILAALLQTYMSISIPKGAIPLDFTTSPAFVHEVILLKATSNINLPDISIQNITKEVGKDKAKEERKKRGIEYEKVMKQLLKDYWAVLKPAEYHFVRKSLRGGRTEIRDRLMTLSETEEKEGIKIIYQDVTSLYPAMQLTKEFPCGVPKIHFYDWEFRPCNTCSSRKDKEGEYYTECKCSIKGFNGKSLDILDCTSSQPSIDEIMKDSFFGFVCVSLLPPSSLYHPVIQIKKKKDGCTKCENNLIPEDHLKLYLDTPTLKHALKSGYKLIRLHRYDKYTKGKGHWVEAGIEFFIDKERTSGPPPSDNEQGMYCEEYKKEFPKSPIPKSERQAYIALYNHIVKGLGDRLESSMKNQEWSKQPAQRQVYKIFNNCGWGKHAQRPVMPQAKTYNTETQTDEISILFENVSKGMYDIRGCIVFNDGKNVMYTWSNTERSSVNLHNCYLPAGAMVPAYGRLTLLEGLEKVGYRAAMCDTDSIVYKTSLNENENIPFSSLLGRFKEEDISEEGIIEFVGFGPKCYSVKTRKIIEIPLPDGSTKISNLTYTKLKGIRQTIGCAGIDHDYMVNDMKRFLNTGEVNITSVPQWSIKTKLNYEEPLIYTQDYLKDFKLMSGDDMKGFHIKGDSKLYPFGYKI